MPDVSLHGRAAPKSKSINVEANLLIERLENQRRLSQFVQRRALTLSAVLLLSLLALPPLHRFYAEAHSRYGQLSARENLLSAQLGTIKKQQQNVMPALQDSLALRQIRKCNRLFLGQTILCLNQVNPQLYLTNLNIEVSGGIMKFSAQAEAENYDAARIFMTDLGDTNKSDKNGETALLQMSAGGSGWKDGVSFSLEHKVSVGP